MEDIIIIKEKETSSAVELEEPVVSQFELENIKNKIESMDKLHHIEILKILKS